MRRTSVYIFVRCITTPTSSGKCVATSVRGHPSPGFHFTVPYVPATRACRLLDSHNSLLRRNKHCVWNFFDIQQHWTPHPHPQSDQQNSRAASQSGYLTSALVLTTKLSSPPYLHHLATTHANHMSFLRIVTCVLPLHHPARR